MRPHKKQTGSDGGPIIVYNREDVFGYGVVPKGAPIRSQASQARDGMRWHLSCWDSNKPQVQMDSQVLRPTPTLHAQGSVAPTASL